MNRSVTAVLSGLVVALVLGFILSRFVWPLVFSPGRLDLENFGFRVVFVLVGAIPAVLGGFIAARLADHSFLAHGVVTGCLTLVPMLLTIPQILEAYQDVPQSMLPLVMAVVMKPVGGAIGAYLTGRVAPRGAAASA